MMSGSKAPNFDAYGLFRNIYLNFFASLRTKNVPLHFYPIIDSSSKQVTYISFFKKN